jgi:integrase
MIKGNNVADIGFQKPRLSPEERIFKSRLGYDVELFDEMGEFNAAVKMADDTSQVTTLYFSEFESIASDLKEHLKSYFIYLLPRYLPGSILLYNNAIRFFVSTLNEGLSPDMAIEKTLIEDPGRNVSVMKSLVQFLILNEYEGVSFEKAEEVLRLEGYTANKNNYLSLFTLDEELGPFTREELRVLNAALKNEEIHVADRLILALCIKFGLRPIQMSLLKESDFVEDEELGLFYLNVPRVKQNNRYRRTEFTKRFVDDELASLIKRVISSNKVSYEELQLDSPPLFYRKIQGRTEDGSLFEKVSEEARLKKGFYRLTNDEHFAEPDKKAYAHHLSPRLFFHRLRNLVRYLPLSPRTGKPFHLTPYRFRYTVGTNAVVEGMTEEEVADLLDHSSTLCVKHYFRYTREMWELLENATVKRTEQQHFTAAWNREDDLSCNIYGLEVIELHAFTAIGKCQKEVACYLEPAVACYTCNKFCPNKEKASHGNALTSLKERKAAITDSAPASLSKQLDEAIAGCQAAIAYSEGAEVVIIHQGVSDE